MSFLPKLFYNDAPEGGGGENATATKQSDENNGGQQELSKPIFTEAEIKEFGFDSPEALKDFLVKQKEANVPDDIKKERENITKANLLKFAAENKLLTVDDYNQYESLKSKSDQDLVFDSFLKDFKEEHPEITDAKELEEAAKEDFNFEYKLKDGLSEAAKKKGLSKLSRDAKELRNPVESKVTTAQKSFEDYNSIQQTYPKFQKFVNDAVTKNTPDKTVIVKVKDGEEEIPIEIELTQKERDAMIKDFSTVKNYNTFLEKKPEEINAILDKKMQGWVKLNKFEDIAAKTFELGVGRGTAKGSNIGAENPFPLRQHPNVLKVDNTESLEESNKKMSSQRERLSVTR